MTATSERSPLGRPDRMRAVSGQQAGILALGTAAHVRGLTGVLELVEGSLSHEVAEHARRPVVVVPPNAPPLS